jgi:hypothetical protein
MRKVYVLSAALLGLSIATAQAQELVDPSTQSTTAAPEPARPGVPLVPPPAPSPPASSTVSAASPGDAIGQPAPSVPLPARPRELVGPQLTTAPEKKPSAGKPQLKLELENGTSIRFGAMTQVQYEAVGQYADHEVSQNIFVRRVMLLIGGNILRDFEYFIDTDFADLFKPSGDMALKNGPGISLKDAIITWKAVGNDVLRLDAGLMLPPLSRISLQGAPFLYGLDFFSNAYTHSPIFGTSSNSYGRDLGLQARGALLAGHIEYRAGVFQGKRNPATDHSPVASNPFRYAGRLQFNVFDPELVYFLRGTNLGEKKILSFAGSFDVQPAHKGNYVSYAADALLDIPLVTAQVDYVYRDGGGNIALPKQQAFMAEAGVNITFLRLSPMLRAERRWGTKTTVDETDIGAGLSFWAFGHNANLKAYYVRGMKDHAADYDQFVAQAQLFYY